MSDFNKCNECSRFIIFFLISLLAIVLFRTAWVSDDAYITMRTVDNFTNGYGLVYNLGERVQSYTHPLWLFLISGVYSVTHKAYSSLIFVSVILTLLMAIIFAMRIAQTQYAVILGIVAILLSKSFIDFSTSGLENPLTHLLIVLFVIVYLTTTTSLKKLFVVSFIAAIGALNRLDLILIFLPGVMLTLWEVWKTVSISQRKRILLICAIGFSPLIMWLTFSLLYYGFVFPNTAYAKLNTGIPKNLLFRQGIAYFLSLLNSDPLTLLVIVWGLGIALFSRNIQKWVLAIGVGLYLGYIIYIGGDFMNGRFFTAPFLCAVILISRSDTVVDWQTLALPLGLMLIVGLASPYPSLFSGGNCGEDRGITTIFDPRGVADERAFYYPTTGLLHACRDCQLPSHTWVNDGLAARENNDYVIPKGSMGFFGFYAGSEKYISDAYGLVDPLLARLPIPDIYEWRIGHFMRPWPTGYLETLESRVNQISDPQLAEFYDYLTIITRGDILDRQRLITVWKMNTGQYKHLLPQANTP